MSRFNVLREGRQMNMADNADDSVFEARKGNQSLLGGTPRRALGEVKNIVASAGRTGGSKAATPFKHIATPRGKASMKVLVFEDDADCSTVKKEQEKKEEKGKGVKVQKEKEEQKEEELAELPPLGIEDALAQVPKDLPPWDEYPSEIEEAGPDDSNKENEFVSFLGYGNGTVLDEFNQSYSPAVFDEHTPLETLLAAVDGLELPPWDEYPEVDGCGDGQWDSGVELDDVLRFSRCDSVLEGEEEATSGLSFWEQVEGWQDRQGEGEEEGYWPSLKELGAALSVDDEELSEEDYERAAARVLERYLQETRNVC